MNSPRSKLRGITSASLRYADKKETIRSLIIPAASSGEFKFKKVSECIKQESSLPSSPVHSFADSPIPAVLGEGWVGEEAVALALYCFLRYPEDYENVVIRGANTNGDSDSIACIGGSISGAYLGINAIPQRWVKRIEKADYLADLAERLAAKKEAIK